MCRVADLLTGYYETVLADGELIAELHVPIRPNWRTTYMKVTTRALHDWPALGLALSLNVQGGQIQEARFVLSGALEKATRLVKAESALCRNEVNDDLIRSVADIAIEEAALESDNRGSADYKNHLLCVYLARAVRFLMQGSHD